MLAREDIKLDKCIQQLVVNGADGVLVVCVCVCMCVCVCVCVCYMSHTPHQ